MFDGKSANPRPKTTFPFLSTGTTIMASLGKLFSVLKNIVFKKSVSYAVTYSLGVIFVIIPTAFPLSLITAIPAVPSP